MINANVLKNLNSPFLTYVSGSLDNIVEKVLPPESCQSKSLVFVSKKEQLELALQAKVGIIIGHKSLAFPENSEATFFSTPSIHLALSAVLPLFDGKLNRFNQASHIHPTAVVHETARVPNSTIVGPNAVIGENAIIGEHSFIGANTVIEMEARVGSNTILHPQVFVGAHCIIGDKCEIHPHTTIGSDGFAFAMDSTGKHIKIPQIGIVVIGDRVELGANCAVDRAALTETRIGNGTKMDNFCHIAHNVTIGEDCVMAAGFIIAGSSSVGNNCMFGGAAAVSDHVAITDRVIIAGRSAVTNDILVSGQYGGYPIEPLRDALKTIANKTHLTRIRRDLAKVMKHLKLNDE